ncbi:MAG: hypothetical protein V1725_05145 [archaeon]
MPKTGKQILDDYAHDIHAAQGMVEAATRYNNELMARSAYEFAHGLHEKWETEVQRLSGAGRPRPDGPNNIAAYEMAQKRYTLSKKPLADMEKRMKERGWI